jgi:hypothetical protein
MRSTSPLSVLLLLLGSATAAREGPGCQLPAELGFGGEQLNGPGSMNYSDYLGALRDYRTNCLATISFNGSIFEVPELKWTQTSYMQPQMHPYDKSFYDPNSGYTVDAYVQDLKDRYGGIDSVLVWPTYTNIGADDRSQFELIEAMPGGIQQITKVVEQLHAHDIRVLWPYNPWDLGTRRDAKGRTDAQLLADLCNVTNSDGFNGDTMPMVPEEFYLASTADHHPIAIEPEGGGDVESMNWATMGWGYWSYPFVPMVDNWKWLDPRRMTNGACIT